MTTHACLNDKCIGIRIFTGIHPDGHGGFVECYTCTHCLTQSTQPARTLLVVSEVEPYDDEADTEKFTPLPIKSERE